MEEYRLGFFLLERNFDLQEGTVRSGIYNHHPSYYDSMRRHAIPAGYAWPSEFRQLLVREGGTRYKVRYKVSNDNDIWASVLVSRRNGGR